MTDPRRSWGNRQSLLQQLSKAWDGGRVLRERLQDSGYFPRRLVFKSPESSALAHDFDAVRAWVAEIEALKGFRIEWQTVRHRIVGSNRLPAEARHLPAPGRYPRAGQQVHRGAPGSAGRHAG